MLSYTEIRLPKILLLLCVYYSNKLEIIAITHHVSEHASKALMRNPIVNNRHIVDAGDVNDSYETENQPLLILTDKTHKILYAIKGNAAITPRILNNTLKETL